MAERREHLGVFGDWVDAARRQRRQLWPPAPPTDLFRSKLTKLLGFSDDSMAPEDTRTETSWERDGLTCEEVSWSLGYGPRARAWVLKPSSQEASLPGVVALHGKGGSRYFGKEEVADGPGDTPYNVTQLRAELYEGRAFANELAKEGFVVLAHDAFSRGSRRFPMEEMPKSTLQRVEDYRTAHKAQDGEPDEVELYDVAAESHEYVLAKYCVLLGTTLAGVVAYEDRAAVNYLCSRPDVNEKKIGCIGLAEGGCRAALLQATSGRLGTSVVVGAMSSYEHLLDRDVDRHPWTFFPELPRHCDWPDFAACRAPSPLLVQYNREDASYTLDGMLAAHRRIAAHYRGAKRHDAYEGQFFDGPQRFDRHMQAAAFAWLKKWLYGRLPPDPLITAKRLW